MSMPRLDRDVTEPQLPRAHARHERDAAHRAKHADQSDADDRPRTTVPRATMAKWTTVQHVRERATKRRVESEKSSIDEHARWPRRVDRLARCPLPIVHAASDAHLRLGLRERRLGEQLELLAVQLGLEMRGERVGRVEVTIAGQAEVLAEAWAVSEGSLSRSKRKPCEQQCERNSQERGHHAPGRSSRSSVVASNALRRALASRAPSSMSS